MNINKLLCSIIFFASAATTHADDHKAPFVLSIVPSSSGTYGRIISTAKKDPDVFYVVLTNISDQPQDTWQTWNSWGFWTISFEFIMPNGKHIFVKKNLNHAWTKNFPSSFLVPVGEHQIYPIRLDAEWDNRPTFAEAGDTHVTLKAIYEVAPTEESTKYKVWTGRIESRTYDFILTHW